MAGLTASGIGSGLDIENLVSQLMTLEQRPLTLLATKEASYQAKLSAFGQLKSALTSLQTAANSLKDAAKFSATKASVADSSLLSVSSTTSASAGSYSVQIDALAKTQRTATSSVSEFVPVAGDLTITFGSVSGGVFTPGSAAAETLTFAGGTLEELRDAINDGDLGVTASVINNGSVKQLVLTGTDTGADQAFSIGGTVGLSYDPASTTVSTDPAYGVQAAQNAQIEVDGIAISRDTNTIDDVIEGVTLTLAKANPGTPTTVTIADDKSGARSAIDVFVKAYNDLNTAIKTLTSFNAETKTASTLTGDSTARGIQSQLRSILGETIAGLSGVSRLSDMGIAFKSDGALTVDSGKLDAALKDPAKNVSAFVAGTDGVTGFAAKVAERLDGFIDSDGLITGRTDGISASIKSIEKQREVLNVRLEQIEKRYRAQFSALDSLVASMTQTSTFLTQQLANLPKIGSSN
jgi:flagellar hook-associated protein 2